MVALPLVVVSGLCLLLLVLLVLRPSRIGTRARGLQEIARLLQNGTTDDNLRVDGTVLGQPVTVRLTTQSSAMLTEISVPNPPGGLAIDFRPETAREKKHIRRGEAIDLQTGDAALDAAYVIEGAPAAAVLSLLDDVSVRRLLTELKPLWVSQKDGLLRAEKFGWLHTEPETAKAIASLLATLALRVPAAIESAGRGLEDRTGVTGVPYREERDGDAARLAQAALRNEVARVVGFRERRHARSRRRAKISLIGAGIVVGITAIGITLALVAH